MPNYSARDMLLRMAEGGSVASANQSVLDFINNNPDASVEAIATKINSTGADLGFLADSLGISRDIADQAYSEAMATNNALLAAEQRILGEIAADPASWNAANAYNEVLKSGVSVQDALDAGVKQSTIDAVFTSGAPLPVTAFSTPSTVTSAFESAPYAGQSIDQIRTGAQNYVAGLMADGVIDEAERREAQAIATQQGVTFQDMLAAGVDPSILFNVPVAEEKEKKVIDVFPQTQTEYVPPTVYQPIAPQPDIYAPGEEALDREFRDSPPRTEVTDQYGNLVGFDYTPAAKLLSATGSGFSFTPPSVTSRPRSLMDTGTLNRYTQGRSAQDLRQLTGANYDQYSGLLNRTGSYGGGLSRSQLYALMRQQDSQRQAAPEAGDATTGTISDYLRLNPDVGVDYARAQAAGELPAGTTPEGFALNHYNTFGRSEIAAGKRAPFTLAQAQDSGRSYTSPAIGQFGEGDEESRQSNFTTQGYNTELLARDLGTAGGARIVPVFAEGGPVKKSEGFADNGPADSMTADELTAQLMAMDTQEAPVEEPRPTDQVQTESRSILDNLNRAMSQVTQPVVAAATDMTVGLGDLAQMGTKAVANKMGIETKPFVPVGENIKASVGADDVSPLNPAYMATQILPFARLQKALAAGPAAYREAMAYLAGEGGAQVAATQFPDSIAAQLAGAVTGDMSARGILDTLDGRNVRRMAGDEPPIDDGPLPEGEPEGTVLGISDQSESGKMLDDVDAIPLPLENLDKTEKAALNKSAGRNPKKRELARSVGEAFKTNYSPDQGWAPVTILGAEFKGNTAKIKTKKIPYGFQNPPEGMEPQQWQQQLSDGIVNEVETVVQRAEAGDQAALDILAQANWYRGMRDQLRSEFGGLGDVFADILGTTSAQTNVEQNFNNAVEILRKYSRGDYDAELAAYQKRVDAGERVDGKTLTAMHKAGEFPLITKDSGALFNTNSPSSMGALLDMFRTVKAGAAPKTPNFTGNLIGLTNEATVDVWAARMLRRLSGQDRIPPAAEQGVTGTHRVGSTLFEPKVGGEFGFGQEVFRDAANRVNQSGSVQRVNPDLGALGPDDLQAIAWFMEKERWAKNGWTTKSGEGGSLEYEMSLAGSQSPERVAELRREVNAGFKPPKQRKNETDSAYDLRVMDARTAFEQTRRAAQDELASLAAPLSRIQLGVAGERPNQPMSGYAQAELAAEFDDVVRDDPSVLTYNLANTYGSFMGDTERALNAEFIVRDNFDMQPLRTRLIEQGKAYDQDAVFLSRVVPDGTPNARPGVEIYFRETITPEQMAKVTERLREKGVDGFTYVTDMRFNDRINRQTRSGDPETAGLTGLRFQYVPEFDDAFDPQNPTESYNKAEDLFDSVVRDTIADGNVSDARLTYYDTEVYFRDDYDEQLRNTVSKDRGKGREGLPSGANGPQSNSGAEVGTKLSTDVPDGVVQEAQGIGSLPTNAPQALGYDAKKIAKLPRVVNDPVAERFNEQVGADPEAAIAQYRQLPDSKGGKVLNTDFFRELSPDYRDNRTLSSSVQETSNALNELMYQRALRDTMGQDGQWVFTGGGAASGKTAGLPDAAIDSYDLVVDGTLANFEKTSTQIDQALDSGKAVTIIYVDRPPEKALPLLLGRANKMENELGSGRTVPLDIFLGAHRDARESIKKIDNKYKNDDRVAIQIVNNHGAEGEQFLTTVDKISEMDYNTSLPKITQALEDAYEQGKISESIYLATKGNSQPRPESTQRQAPKDDTARNAGDEPKLEQGNQVVTEQQRQSWREANKGNFKQEQTPELAEAAEKLGRGEISISDYSKEVDRLRPITPLTEVPRIATFEDIASALDANKVAKGIIGLDTEIADGTMVGSRLDIPAYNNYNTWVVSVHEGAGTSGSSLGYGKIAVLDDVKFNSNAKSAFGVATGKKPKASFARMNGKWRNVDPEVAKEQAEKYINDPNWTQVGMNPYRHSFFYDKATGQPVDSAKEVIQIGPLVLARDVKTRPLESPEHALDPKKRKKGEPEYFKKGGSVERVYNDNRTYK